MGTRDGIKKQAQDLIAQSAITRMRLMELMNDQATERGVRTAAAQLAHSLLDVNKTLSKIYEKLEPISH